MKKVVSFFIIVFLCIGLTLYYKDLPSKSEAKVPPKPDFSKIELRIAKVTVYSAGKITKVINRSNADLSVLESKLFNPVAYSGLFEQTVEGKQLFRLPALYVPNIDELISGKVYGRENVTVVILDLAKSIDMTFANNVAGIPKEFTQLVFLPLEPEYKQNIIFANGTMQIPTSPTHPYNPNIFNNLR